MPDAAISPRASVGQVRLSVADLGAMLEFYSDVLGLRPALTERDGTVHLSADGRYPFLFGLTGVPGATRPPRRTTGLYHSAVLVPSRAWLGRLLRRLVAKGIDLDGASDHLVSEALYLRDPEGNGVELYADRPREAWPHVDGQVMMTTEPLDLDALIAEGRDGDAPWDGLPPDTRVGHVHLRVSALDRAEAFYHGVLGFDVTVRGYPGALFVSAGGYHHHLGLNTWHSAGTAPAPAGSVGLCSFTVELPDERELADVLARVEAAGVPSRQEQGGVLVRDPFANGVLLTARSAR